MIIRELPSAEWLRLIDQGVEPYCQHGLPPDNGHWRILVTEDESGRITGCVSLHTQVHFDPWWISEDQRGNPGVVRGLIRESVMLLDQLGIDHVYATIGEANVEMLAERLGFSAAPGRLYLLDVNQLKEI